MNLAPLAPWLGIIEIILAIALTVLVLLQSKGSDMGFFGGGDSSSGYRTKRGVEIVLHRATIGLIVLFFIWTFFTFIAYGQA